MLLRFMHCREINGNDLREVEGKGEVPVLITNVAMQAMYGS